MKVKKKYRFIDLFSGLGGFHVALGKLGHKCVFASEIVPFLRKDYEKNFKLRPDGDITKINIKKIPAHEILCAGFPCQPFSKAGSQEGFDHKISGDMFSYILKILTIKKPKYIFLENVPQLLNHNAGKTWRKMEKKINNLGYLVRKKIISPIDYGIPQTRKRFYMVAYKDKKHKFSWPKNTKKIIPLSKLIIKKPKKIKYLTNEKYKVLKLWNDILAEKPNKIKLINPLWTSEFRANYPYIKNTPSFFSSKKLSKFNGKYGESLKNKSKKEQIKMLPSYAQSKEKIFPNWKIKIIEKNRLFYKNNKKWCDTIIKRLKLLKFESHQKFEWNCMGDSYNLKNKLISFRPSGIRIKRNTSSPTLIASTVSQVPILFEKKRYLSFEECMSLQGFPKKFHFANSFQNFYFAIGNSVNCDVVKKIAKNLIY